MIGPCHGPGPGSSPGERILSPLFGCGKTSWRASGVLLGNMLIGGLGMSRPAFCPLPWSGARGHKLDACMHALEWRQRTTRAPPVLFVSPPSRACLTRLNSLELLPTLRRSGRRWPGQAAAQAVRREVLWGSRCARDAAGTKRKVQCARRDSNPGLVRGRDLSYP